MSVELDAKTRALIESASRYQESEDRNALERALAASDRDVLYAESGPIITVSGNYGKYGSALELVKARAPGSKVRASAEHVPHPKPVHVSTDPAPIDPPSAVLGLKAKVESQGWRVNVTYARGNGVHASLGTPTKVVDSWALRCWMGPFRATAVCVGGTWESMWGVAHMFHARTQGQWLEYLNEVAFGDVDAWLPGARAENLARAAVKPCADPDVHEAHPWGEFKCKGRETAKAKRTREHGS